MGRPEPQEQPGGRTRRWRGRGQTALPTSRGAGDAVACGEEDAGAAEEHASHVRLRDGRPAPGEGAHAAAEDKPQRGGGLEERGVRDRAGAWRRRRRGLGVGAA